MPDIIITPTSGIIDFFPVATRVGRIEGSGNTINIINPSGFVAVSGSGLSINTSSPNATFHAYSATSGATLLNIEGTNGSLFSVVDNLSGTLMSVNNNAGLPVFEVFSDDRVVAGRFGQNDFIMTSGGNVGIGTGVPSSKFHVVGLSTFNGDVSSTGSFIAGSGSAANPSFEFIGDVDTGMFSPASNVIGFATSGVERLRVDSVGNIGIGTASPTSRLQVSGLITANSGNFTNSLQVNSTGVSLTGHTHTTSDITNFNSSVSGLLPSNLVYTTGTQTITGNKTFGGSTTTVFTTGAKVGIGINSPEYLLDIYDENIFIPFRARDSNNNYITIGPSEDGAGVVRMNGLDRIYLTTNNGNIDISGALSINGNNLTNAALGSASNGQLLIGNGSSFTKSTLTAGTGIGITNSSGTITIGVTGIPSSSITNFNSSVSGLLPTGTFNYLSKFGAGGSGLNNSLIFDNGTNVGIGTVNPTSKLQVSGLITANSGSFLVGSYGIHIEPTTDTFSGFHLIRFQGNNTQGSIYASEDGEHIGFSGVDWRFAGTKVTISTQTASTIASFDVDKNIVSLSTDTYPSITELSYVKGTTSAIQTQINSKQNILSNPVTGTGTTSYLPKWTSSSGVGNSLIFDNGTNIGIGTISPASNFHISAVSDANYGNILVSGTNVSTNIGLGGISDTVPFLSSLSAGNIATSVYGFGMFYRNSDGDFALSRKGGSTSWIRCLNIQRSNGNVGIGSGIQATTVPERLTVDGNIRVADTSVTQGNIVQFNRGGGGQYDYSIGKYSPALAISLANDSSSQRPLQVGFHSGTTFLPRFHVNGYTGAVGINTTTPSGYLDVAGDVFIRGNPGTAGRINFKSSTFADTLLNIRSDTGGNIYLDGGGPAIKCGSQDGQLDLRGYSTNVQIGHVYNAATIAQHVRFTPGSVELMRMTNSGTIGIGLPLTSSLFNIQPFANCRLHIMGSGANSSSSALNVANSGNNSLLFVRNDGNVGVGTTNPNSQLHVVGSGLFSGDVTSSGSFIGGSGTAALPSFEFIGDPDTGLFSPTSNTFSISTSGVERFRINNVGNVGIGTTNYAFNNLSASDDANLSINSTAWIHNALQIGPVDNGYDYTWITNGAAIFNTVGVGEKVDYPGNAVVMSTNGLTVNNAGGLGGSACQLLPDQGAIIENSLIINSNANGGATVGIGTSSPGSPLTISTNSAAGTIAGASQTQIFQVNDASSSDYVNLGHFNCESNLSRGSFMLSNNGSNAAWEDNCLQFFSHGSSYGYGYYGSNTSDAGCAMIVTQGSEIVKLQIGNYNAAPIEFFTNNTFRIRIDTSGNLGIGTAIPSSKLHVIGDINCNSINIVSATGVTVSSSGLNNIWSREVSISGARSFTAKLSAYNATNTAAAGWNIRGLVKRLNTGNPSIVGTNIVEKWNDTTFNISTANVITSGTSLVIQVSGFPTSSTSVRADISYT